MAAPSHGCGDPRPPSAGTGSARPAGEPGSGCLGRPRAERPGKLLERGGQRRSSVENNGVVSER